MTDKKTIGGVEDAPGTAEGQGHKTTEPKAELFTSWADGDRMEAAEDFNEDQAAVHAWMEATDELRMEALETAMTLADAEELIGTAKQVASEHMRRAERARNLVTIVAARLGREADALTASDPVTIGKAVPVVGTQKPQGARTATRPIPTSSPSSAELPSAL